MLFAWGCRVLEPWKEPDPKGAVFGFGRKLVEERVFVAVAKTFAVFVVRKIPEGTGQEDEEEQGGFGLRPAMATKPLPFAVRI